MAAGSVVVSKTCKPDAEASEEMVHLLEAINKKLTNVMQGTVQMVSVRASRSQLRRLAWGLTLPRTRVGFLGMIAD